MRNGNGFSSWRVAVFNTDKAVMVWLAQFGGNVHWRTRIVRATKPAAQWHVSNIRDMIALLEAVHPYLVIKRSKAETALAELRVQWSEIVSAQL